jgi:microtubule-associated protein-like 6
LSLHPHRGHKDKIFVIKWNPFSSDQLVTVGIKHIKFWTQTGGGFTSKRGIFGNVAKQDTMLCVTYGKTAEMVYSGGTSGKVFVWEGNTLKEVIQAHQGTVMAMQTLEKVKGNIASKISPRLPFKPGEPGSILG